jgi:hypothetical protein
VDARDEALAHLAKTREFLDAAVGSWLWFSGGTKPTWRHRSTVDSIAPAVGYSRPLRSHA